MSDPLFATTGNVTLVEGIVGGAGTIDPEAMAFHIDIFIIALTGAVVLFRLPRAFGRFWRLSEWSSGYYLRNTPYARPASTFVRSTHVSPPPRDVATDDSHTLYSHTNHLRVDEKGAPVSTSYPPHIAACASWLRPLVVPLRWRLAPRYSLAQFVVLLIYFSSLCYACFYKSSPFTDPKRVGCVAAAQLPFVYAFATKNNVAGVLLGDGYAKLNFMHRFVGRMVVVAVNLHAIYYFYEWSLTGIFMTSVAKPTNVWGFVGLVCLDLLVFFSTDYWRQRAYNLFLGTHILSFSLILPAVLFHKSTTRLYVFTCVGIYVLDYVTRLVKARFVTATIRPLPELGVTRVEVPYLNNGWRAGQHVRLRVFSSGMGWLGWSEIHPFTISSVSGGQEGLVLLCKKAGSWTTKLYEMAKTSGYVEGGTVGRSVDVMIEGPYGGSGHAIFASYSAAVFVVGGSGITFGLSAIQDLIRKDLKGESRVKVIELIWAIPDPAALVPLVPLLTSLIQESVFTPLRISVFYTRAPIGKFPFASDYFIPGLTLAPGRPRISKVLDSAICRAVSLGAGPKDSERITGMLVGVCGPAELGDEVAKSVGTVEPLRRDQVGGIELHEEVFGW